MAQYAPMGANNCTHIAIMTTGMNFPICQRIEFAPYISAMLKLRAHRSRYDVRFQRLAKHTFNQQNQRCAKTPYSGKGDSDRINCAPPQI